MAIYDDWDFSVEAVPKKAPSDLRSAEVAMCACVSLGRINMAIHGCVMMKITRLNMAGVHYVYSKPRYTYIYIYIFIYIYMCIQKANILYIYK